MTEEAAAEAADRLRLTELGAPLELLPPVDFCCVYGSFLLPNNHDKTSMVDYILGVPNPVQWHAENLEKNRHHYSKWMARLGPAAIAGVADRVGVGVHFNPFVECRGKMIKYGVVSMHDLAMDILTWNRFYISGRLQKPIWSTNRDYVLWGSPFKVRVLIDNWDLRKVNLINLKSAISAAFLLLPAEFTEEDLYSRICSLSYMGDVRMLFAEDKNKVNNIVRGSFQIFQSMYKPLLQDYAAEGMLRFPSEKDLGVFIQDCDSSAISSHIYSLPWIIQNNLGLELKSQEPGCLKPQIGILSKDVVAHRLRIAFRRVVMASSARQAVSGLVATGGMNAVRYLSKKMQKAWKSRISVS